MRKQCLDRGLFFFVVRGQVTDRENNQVVRMMSTARAHAYIVRHRISELPPGLNAKRYYPLLFLRRQINLSTQ
jgi:hypothetical protein